MIFYNLLLDFFSLFFFCGGHILFFSFSGNNLDKKEFLISLAEKLEDQPTKQFN